MREFIFIFMCLLPTVPSQAGTVVYLPLDTDPGWTTEGKWKFGVPHGGGGPESYDPTSGRTGSNVYGYNLAGNYDNGMPEYRLTTAAMNCKLAENVQLGFWRWLAVESGAFDHAKVQVSNNGTDWTDVWANGDLEIIDTSWVYCSYDISAVANRQPTVFIRWCMGPTDSSASYAGWNIDDVALTGDLFDALSISTTDKFISSGPVGGPFSPVCKSYTLTNRGYEGVTWVAEASQPWIEIAPDEGTLPPAGSIPVEICIAAGADALAEGFHTGTVSFTNTSSGLQYFVDVTLYFGDGVLVPVDFGTIQAAIDAASHGDTIIVLDGTYSGAGNRNIDFKGKRITLKSQSGPDNCTVSAVGDTWQDLHRGFYFHSGEDSESVVEGLSICYGRACPGGGIYCLGSSPTIRDCVIRDNRLTSESSSQRKGGGIYCDNSSPGIINCIIRNNIVHYYGGGIYCGNGSAPVITDCVIRDNVASYPQTHSGWAGGVYLDHSNAALANCLISGNSSFIGPGGISCSYSSPVIVNCTIADNDAQGVANYYGKPSLVNCILWGNGGTDQSAQIYTNKYLGDDFINYSCVQGWTGSLGGTGNIGTDPMFVDPDNDDLHLQLVSGCIDSGDNSAVTGGTDLDGNPRISNGTVDMGAYESQHPASGPRTLYVDDDGAADFDTIQAAIDDANDGDEVVVWPGVYQEAINFKGKAIAVKSAAELAVIEAAGMDAVTFHSGEGPGSVLKNFIIRNSGMAISTNYGSSPTISSLTIVNNDFGIGAYEDSDPNISNCIIWDNKYGDLFGCEARYSWVQQELEPDLDDPNGGLVSHWAFDEGAGLIAYDSAGDNDGVVSGAQWTTGQIGGSLDFDGINDYVALPDNNPIWLPQNNFTLSAWVYFDRAPAASGGETFLGLNFADSGTPSNELGYVVSRLAGSGRAAFGMTTLTNTDENLYSNAVLSGGRWYLVVAIRNGTTQAIYLNGELDNSRGCSPDPIDFVGGYDDDKVSIGRVTSAGVGQYYVDGRIDDVRIYDRALSASEVLQLYEPGAGIDPLFADAVGGDYHLLSERGRYWPAHDVWVLDRKTSPCIDGGDPAVDPSGEPMPNGGRINIGAYGGTVQASMSEWPIASDYNRDGRTNFEDLAIFCAEWLATLPWADGQPAPPEPEPDSTPPTPSPMVWDPSGLPHDVWIGPDTTFGWAAAMTSAVASDPSGPVQYYFESLDEHAYDSGWIATKTYTTPVVGRSDQLLRFRVKARDAYNNETAWSPAESSQPPPSR